MRKAALLFVLLAAIALVATVQGTHEADHRYYVSGTLTRPDGSPACGVAVEAGPDTDGNVHRATTDRTGSYRILLHFHNIPEQGIVEVGAEFQVRVVDTGQLKTATTALRATDDAWGESVVNFGVPAGVGKACTSLAVVAGLYVGLPVALLAGLAVSYVKVIRPWWRRRPRTPPLSSLPGIGAGRLRALKVVGVTSVLDLAHADPVELARQISISKREAKRLVKRAAELLPREEA